MKKITVFLFLFVSVTSLFAQKAGKDRKAILDVLHRQEAAWNRGDLAGFMDGYWTSDSLKFIGKSGITYGWQPTLDNYKKSYPTPDAMGQLTFTILGLERLSSKSAFVIGKWHLARKTDALHGHFTLLWKKVGGKWVIVADHSS